MVGTRSGINTTIPSKKEKTTMRGKDVKTKKPGQESNKHGVRVRGLRSSESADGQAGGAITGSSIPPVNPSLSAVRKAMLEKSSLSITDITGEVSSSSSSEERREDVVAAEEETITHGSPIESHHEVVQGNPETLFPSDENPRDSNTLNSLLGEQEPPPSDAIGGILGLGGDVLKDVPTSSSLRDEKEIDQGQDVGEDILASLKEKV